MSVQAMSWAVRQEAAPGPKFILILLANRADSAGVTWIGRKRLVTESGFTRPATISKYLGELEGLGLISRVQRRRGDGYRTSDYTVLAPNFQDRGEMLDGPEEEHEDPAVLALAKKGSGTPCVPEEKSDLRYAEEQSQVRMAASQVRETGRQEPSEEPSEELPISLTDVREKRASGQSGRNYTYQGKTVPWKLGIEAEELLKVFNEATGRKIGPRNARGEASPDLRQIIGAMLERPSVGLEDWRRAVVNTVSNPPDWMKGGMTIGIIFGEKAASHSLANPGKSAKGARLAGSSW